MNDHMTTVFEPSPAPDCCALRIRQKAVNKNLFSYARGPKTARIGESRKSKMVNYPVMKHKQYIIRSTHRDESKGFFVAIHGFTPFYSDRDKARRFSSAEMATAYANTELFDDASAFEVIAVPERAMA